MRIGLLCAAVSLCALLGTPASAQVQERTIRWGHLNNTDHPVSFGVQKFAEVLAAKSGGKLKIREFAASQLGNEMQQQSAVRGGTQEILSASTTSLAGVVKDSACSTSPSQSAPLSKLKRWPRACSERPCSNYSPRRS